MSLLMKGYYILRYLGPRVITLRAGVYLRNALGITQRTYRSRPWDTIRLSEIYLPGIPADPAAYAAFKRANPPPFLFPLGQPPTASSIFKSHGNDRSPDLAERLRLLSNDRCVYFFRNVSPEPIDWYGNPFDHSKADAKRPWYELPDYLPSQGDPRTMWEPSRAAWAIDLARARSHGLGADAGELYWRWVDSWMAACPPYMGFQWKCGQESSVRLIAISLGFWSLASDPSTTPERWEQFARLAWATGYRVAHHIDYAISQKNNHAISEACALILVGQLFPEFRESAAWLDRGRQVLAAEIRRQTYADGSYVQQSMNYHRVMLHGSLLGMRLAELAGKPFDRDIYEIIGRCAEFLFQMIEPSSGRVPKIGNNDGAYVLPLSECDFTDLRPAIQAAYFLAHRKRLLPDGPWNEDLLWLFGPESLTAAAVPSRVPASCAFDVGGYYTLRQSESWAMIRCHDYRDRPGQCDQMHVDLWWRGQNVLQDCGLFKYYIPDRTDLEYFFRSSAAHNTVEVDGSDPMTLYSRFMWFPWLRAKRRQFQPEENRVRWFEGEHYGYDRAPWHVIHRRTVIGMDADTWIVVDDLLASGSHTASLRWQMLDAPFETDAATGRVCLRTPKGRLFMKVIATPDAIRHFEIIRGRDEPGRTRGFTTSYYGERSPIPTMEVSLAWNGDQRVITLISPDDTATLDMTAETPDTQQWRWLSARGETILELASPRRDSRVTLQRVLR